MHANMYTTPLPLFLHEAMVNRLVLKLRKLRIISFCCAALCAKGDHMDCEVCGSRDACDVVSEGDSTPTCNCYSNCYDHGDCCTDVSLMRNCLGRDSFE